MQAADATRLPCDFHSEAAGSPPLQARFRPPDNVVNMLDIIGP
jgi:hypothetical protein